MRRRRGVVSHRESDQNWHTHGAVHQLESETRKETALRLGTRLDAMNQLREQLNRQAATFVSRETLDALLLGINDAILALTLSTQSRIDRLEQSSKSAAIRLGWYSVAFGLTSVVLAVTLLLVLASRA